MATVNDLERAYYAAQLGLPPTTTLTVNDLYSLFLAGAQYGIASNRRFSTGLYYGPECYGGNSTRVPTLNELDVLPFIVGQQETFDQIACAVTILQATSLYRLGVYNSDTQGKPSTLLFDAGTVDCSTTGAKTITINQKLNAGLYWIAGCAQVAAGTMELRGYAAGWSPFVALDLADRSTSGTGYFMTGVTGALPGTFTFAANNAFSGATPRLLLRST